MEVEVNWSAVCLICLQEEEEMKSLHEKDHLGNSLIDKVIKCLDIKKIDCILPEQICLTCENDLNIAFKFKSNAENSLAILKSLYETKFSADIEIEDDKNKVDTTIFHENTLEDDEDDDYEATIEENLADVNALHEYLVMDKKSQKCKTKSINASKGTNKKNSSTNDIEDDSKIPTKKKIRVMPVRKDKNKPHKICEICGNTYKYQNALESHMRRHRNEKPFSCEFCNRSFVANVELRRHMRVHTRQKPYTCHYCPRAFSDFGSRGKHERTHTGERPYSCGTCGKTFAYSHVLSVHALTHTGEKKFKCEFCERGFTKKLYLDGHIKNNHAHLIKTDT